MRFIIGKVRSGKTARIYKEVRERVERGIGRTLILVPEQYTHEAERELALICGDRLSLFAEVMSFTGFARWNRSVRGGSAFRWLDEGGKLLCLAVALRELQPVLRLYADAAENPELQAAMVKELDTIRAADIGCGDLRELSQDIEGGLSRKLSELATVMEAYEAVMERTGMSAREPLSLLADQIAASGLSEFDRVYVDGFLDFTGLELKVLMALIKRGTDLTIVLTGSRDSRLEEQLLISRMTMERLSRIAAEAEVPLEIQWIDEGANRDTPDPVEDMLGYFADHMFDYGAQTVASAAGQIRLLTANTPALECETAAAEVLKAVRDEGLRWRDFAIAVRGFSDYRGLLEHTFRRYGIPLFVTRRDPLVEKPLPYWISCAYELVHGGWDVDDMTSYLRCGFSGLSEEICDALCSYLFLWQLKAPAWLQSAPWRQHPDGYGKPRTPESESRLAALNDARWQISQPLLLLKERSEAASDAVGQAAALRAFLEAANIPDLLQQRIDRLERNGELELRAEYLQLWELLGNAIGQMSSVLGHMPMDGRTFSRLLKTVLSCYDIGMIPVSLDRVSAGDFDRMRRRNIRRLIVLGCTDDRLPSVLPPGGIFSQEERDRMAEKGLALGGGEGELWREYTLIYHTLSLPREQLILTCPETGLSGESQTPALVYSMAMRLFSLRPEKLSPESTRLNAAVPALGLALSASAAHCSPEAQAAVQWFRLREPERLRRLKSAAQEERGSLSSEAVHALYGKHLKISPSRLETFSDCRFRYYCQYGMKAEPMEPAGFQPPEIGTFTHEVLEKTARAVSELGGFRAVTDEQLREITEACIQEYIHTELGDFQEKSARFRWLFERLCEDVIRVVQDTADELRISDFEPLSFELDMSKLKTQLDCGDAGSVSLTGVADRVDGFRDGNGLMLRVVDYKTGKKQFQLYDLLYGRNMQMLLYLFAVCDHAEELYGEKARPAGLMYVPARDNMLHFDTEPDDAEQVARRKKEKRRSGLMLSEPSVIKAWEHGDVLQYSPQKTRTKDPSVSRKQLDLLRQQTEEKLREMAEKVSGGCIDANPSWQSDSENACQNCPYHPVCRFEDGKNGEISRVIRKMTDDEVWEQLMPGDGESPL